MEILVPYDRAVSAKRAVRHCIGLVGDVVDRYPRLCVGDLSRLLDALEATNESLRELLETEAV